MKQKKKTPKKFQKKHLSGHPADHRAPRAPAHRPSGRACEGVFHGTARGFGFVTPDPASADGITEDIFIPAGQTGGALDGDRVSLSWRYSADRFGTREGGRRTEGRVTAVLEDAPRQLIGRLEREKARMGKHTVTLWWFLCENTRVADPIRVLDPGDAMPGDKVMVAVSRRRDGSVAASVVRTYGADEDRAANYEAILDAHGVRTAFPDDVEREAAARAALPLSVDGRTDRRDDVIFTIDGASAKDLDDAVSLRRTAGGGWLLGVHIADVSEYVTPSSALDAEAGARGTSLYFADRVVPMLPRALSNGACSLNPGEDRYALSAVLFLSPSGEILTTKITRSLIRSRVRGVYSEVNDLFENGKASPFASKYKDVVPALDRMRALYKILEKKNSARGALEFERPDPVILLDENGEPENILCPPRGEAEKMIEQFMLTANEGVAVALTAAKCPCVYRVHDRPEPDRLADFRQYAHNLGLDIRPLSGDEPDGRALRAVLEEAKEKGLSSAVSYTLLRTMAKALYSEKPGSHFGLGIPLYCHFTSPIRRLSDLATHRIIKAVLLDGEPADRYRAYAARAAEAATEGELRALDTEREIEALYKTVYMSHRIGEEYAATVSAVTSFGLFCELPDTCEGLVPLDTLRDTYGEDFSYDEGNLSLVSRRYAIRVGDSVKIRVESAEIPSRKVRFSLV